MPYKVRPNSNILKLWRILKLLFAHIIAVIQSTLKYYLLFWLPTGTQCNLRALSGGHAHTIQAKPKKKLPSSNWNSQEQNNSASWTPTKFECAALQLNAPEISEHMLGGEACAPYTLRSTMQAVLGVYGGVESIMVWH